MTDNKEKHWADRKDDPLYRTLFDIGRAFIKRYPRQMALATALLLLASALEGIGILALLPLLDFLIGDAESKNHVTVLLGDLLSQLGVELSFNTMLLVLVGLVFLKSGFMFCAKLYVANTSARITRDFRLTILRALTLVRWQFFTAEPIGQVANSIIREAENASYGGLGLMMLASFVIQLLVYLGTATVISWELTLAGVVGGLVIAVALRVFVEMTRKQGAVMTELNRSYTSRIVDFFLGLKPIKAMGRENNLSPLLEQKTGQILESQKKLNFASVGLSDLQEPIAAVMVAILIYVVVQHLELETSALLVMVALFARTVGRIGGLLKALRKLASVEAPYYAFTSRLQAIQDDNERNLISDRVEREDSEHFDRSLVLDAVGFTYEKKAVLREISMDIRFGELVAIVGPSGAGKSTLLDLLCGLLKPDKGRILVDDVDLSTVDTLAWRRLIGYVPQETTLFHGTILENLSLGDPDVEEEDVVAALKDAGAWTFVSTMEGGLQAMVGERGLKISGGQRQRLAIARALVFKPRLLLLDEATSALDSKTEREFCETLRRLVPQVTIVAISHRPAIGEIADRCYHLVEGRIVAGESAAAAAAETALAAPLPETGAAQ